MFFYRYMLFSFILRKIKNLVVNLLFFAIFLYFSSLIFIAMKEGISVAFAYKDPKNVAIYAYKYLKWCYYNSGSLTYSIFFKAGVSLVIPFWFYLKISKINWSRFFRSLFEYVFSMLKKDTYDSRNLEFNGKNNIDFEKTDYREELYRIKRNAIIEIEESINKMTSEILCIKNKKDSENYNNIIDKN
ncbi:hypothetical protein [Ehrlichia japonica]|uniref:Uncharacterized protein n=1 Tax=Ehrlichia japonica TaxID=391036 RepID=X5GJP7_9RICK|nr:hypothetical protein [Ehrlichia japonica]AHX04366.1 hypothetical protein EHF_0010 [Ehrlichia japonica]